MKSKNTPVKKGEDYAFHFELKSQNNENTVYDNSLFEMIRKQITNLLEIITLTKDEKEVSIDGFKFLCDDNTIYRLFQKDREKE